MTFEEYHSNFIKKITEKMLPVEIKQVIHEILYEFNIDNLIINHYGNEDFIGYEFGDQILTLEGHQDGNHHIKIWSNHMKEIKSIYGIDNKLYDKLYKVLHKNIDPLKYELKNKIDHSGSSNKYNNEDGFNEIIY